MSNKYDAIRKELEHYSLSYTKNGQLFFMCLSQKRTENRIGIAIIPPAKSVQANTVWQAFQQIKDLTEIQLPCDLSEWTKKPRSQG